MKKKSLGINAVLNGMRNILNIIFPIITFPYVSRVLRVGEIGKYNFSSSFVSYFLLIAALGISTYAVREGSKIRDDYKKLSNFASQIFSINIVSTIISYILLFLCLLIFKKLHSYTSCIIIFSIQIIFTTIGTEWIYTIFEDFTYITARSILFKIISVILLFLLVRKPGDYLNYAMITVFSTVGSNVLNYIHAKKFCDIKITMKIEWKKHIKPILVIFASSVAITIYLSLDTTLLGIMKNDYAVGIYAVSTKIYNIIKQLMSAILTVTIPRFAYLWGEKKIREFKDLLCEISDVLALIAIPASVGVFMLAPQIILILSSSKYIQAVTSLRLLCPALIFSIFSWIFTSCVLIPIKRENKVLVTTIIAAVFNLVFNILFIPVFSENAAAFLTSLSEFISMVMGIYFCNDILSGIYTKSFWKNIFVYLIGSLSIIVVCIVFKREFTSYLVSGLFSIVFSIISYTLVLIVGKNEYAFQIIKVMKAKFFK